jgi:cell division protein FtsN
VPAEEKAPVKTEVKPAPKTTKPAATSPPPERIQPISNGPYMVQTASFGDADNADKEAQRLKKLGYDARVKMGNTSDDKLFYRVKIGYFKSRNEALAYIKQNHRHMPNAIPAHR